MESVETRPFPAASLDSGIYPACRARVAPGLSWMDYERLREAFEYIDEVVAQLEAFHVAGRKRVPRAFMPRLWAINNMAPEAKPPGVWNTLIRRTIEECFGVQERLQALRDREGR
jgi:hypothetical protein